jgi:hypothetical protein
VIVGENGSFHRGPTRFFTLSPSGRLVAKPDNWFLIDLTDYGCVYQDLGETIHGLTLRVQS